MCSQAGPHTKPSIAFNPESCSHSLMRDDHDGLEWLERPGFQLRSPDKKQRRSNTQESSFPPVSEYAPPVNPSTRHLTAANPFDDNYNTASYRQLPSGNPYFRSPGYPGFGVVQMPPNMAPRMSPRFCSRYLSRNPPPQCLQHTVGLGSNRWPNSNFGPRENSGFGRQPMHTSGMRQNVCLPNQLFQHHDENVNNLMQQQNISQTFNLIRESVPHGNPHFNPQVESSYDCIPSEFAYNQPKPSGQKQNSNEGSKKNSNRNSNPIANIPEYIVIQSNAHFRNRSRRNGTNVCADAAFNVDYISSSPENEMHSQPFLPRGAAEGQTSGRSTKTSLHPSRCAPSFSDTVYLCGICTDEVNDRQDALLCEVSCRGWFHRLCTGMSETAYGLLTAEASAVWGCDTCMRNEDVPFTRIRHTATPQE